MCTSHVKYMRMKIKPNTVLGRGCDKGTTHIVYSVVNKSLVRSLLVQGMLGWLAMVYTAQTL
ncbi:rCG37967 [Rattus norvegicus]|uniref:RCG37967 n=1 Tax=Rattus norvegicus TaxID=10116 RepID=A6K5S5_RAT|nr:rCG37967 [Rattus norvegicus]